MKVAVISDIHGNHYALEQVLHAAKKNDVKHLLVLGDLVGYYYKPELVLDLISQWSYDLIQGNHERILFQIKQDELLKKTICQKYGRAHVMALESLTLNQFRLLQSLPERKKVNIEKCSFLLSHGSPWDKDLYLYPDSNKRLLKNFDDYTFDFNLIGHSHYSFGFCRKNSIVLNPGSVGQSREHGGKASWICIDTDNQSFQFKFTEYDTGQLKRDVKKYDPNINYNYEILNR